MAFDILEKQSWAAGLPGFARRDSRGGRLSHVIFLLTRSVISVISRMGSTSVRIFLSSPARSERGDPITQVIVGQEFPRCETRL